MSPEGDKGPYSLYFLLWGSSWTCASSRGCVLPWDQLLTLWVWGAAGSCGKSTGFPGWCEQSHVPTSQILLCSNAHVCLVGLWMLSRTGNGWEGPMSCAKGCRDRGGTHPAPAPHWPPAGHGLSHWATLR